MAAPGGCGKHDCTAHKLRISTLKPSKGAGVANLSISKAWDETRETFAREGNLLATVALALLVLPQAIVGVINPPGQMARDVPGWAMILTFLAAFVGLIGQLALIRLASRPGTSVGESISHGARRFPATLAALVIYSVGMTVLLVPLAIILVMVGTVQFPPSDPPSGGYLAFLFFLVLVVLAVTTRFILMLPISSEESAGPINMLRRSWTLTSGHYWRLLAFLIIIIGLVFVLLVTAMVIGGLIANILGGDVAPMTVSALILALTVALAQAAFTILSSVMLARIYVQLAGGGAAEASVPTTGI